MHHITITKILHKKVEIDPDNFDPYEVLGVSRDASDDEIKKAYRRKSLEYHPDRNNGDETLQKIIGLAKDILLDPDKRRIYDETGDVTKTSRRAKIRQQAETQFLLMVEQLLDRNDVYGDIMTHVTNIVEAAIARCKDEISKRKRIIKKKEKQLGRIKNNKGNYNPIDSMIQKKINKEKKHINNFEYEIEMYEEIKVIMKDYEDTDPGEKPHPHDYFAFDSSTSTW